MAQFEVFENDSAASKEQIPYLLDVQSDLLKRLRTRVAVPLARPGVMEHKAIGRLTPRFEINGEVFVMLTPELAGVPHNAFGRRVTELSAHRTEILGALDFLISGF